jgi:hypothetical protein
MAENGVTPEELGFNSRQWEQFQRDYATNPERALATLEEKFDIHGNPAESTTPSAEATASEREALADKVREQANPRTSGSTSAPERARAAAEAEEFGRPSEGARGGEEELGPPQERPSEMFDDPDAPTPRSGEPLNRPGLGEETKAAIEANAPTNEHGQFVDSEGNVIQEPDYGHTYGHENRRIIAAAEELGLTQEQLNHYVNSRPEFFQIEEHSVNISHANEMPGLEPYDHIVADMEAFFGR